MRRIYTIISLVLLMGCSDDFSSGDSFKVSNSTTGTGGSTARFTISGDFLYLVNNSELKAFDISEGDDPTLTSNTVIDWGVETVIGYENKLFIGTQFGMFVYDIASDGSPVYVSEFGHVTACDPVLPNDQYAYVTIRSGVFCNQVSEVDDLITLDITDLSNPYQVSRIDMINPRGMAFYKGDLYVGEGESGLKRFSLKDPANPQIFSYYPEYAANDMLGLDSILVVTGSEGVFQFGSKPDTVVVNSDTLFYSLDLLSELQ
jgi:hypothetical protein